MVLTETQRVKFLESPSTIQTINVLESRFEIKNICLGSGTYSKVSACFDKLTQSLCACKQILKSHLLSKINKSQDRQFAKQFLIQSIRNQEQIMTKLNHLNIIKFYHRHQNFEGIFFCLEFCNQGNLKDLLNREKYLSFEIAFPIMAKLVSACLHLHTQRIIHRDIKPQNILMNDGEPKLSNFGLAAYIDREEYILAGTLEYTPPEVHTRESITLKSDIWSLGATFYQMLTGKLPWVFKSKNYYYQTLVNTVVEFPQYLMIPSALKQIILEMLSLDYDKRPSIQRLYDFFNI